MKNKTCGECRFYAKETEHCKLKGICWKFATDAPCSGFTPRKPITNGDRIRQMNNEELAEIISNVDCKICPACMTCFKDENETCFDGMLAWLNAPAEMKESENEC